MRDQTIHASSRLFKWALLHIIVNITAPTSIFHAWLCIFLGYALPTDYRSQSTISWSISASKVLCIFSTALSFGSCCIRASRALVSSATAFPSLTSKLIFILDVAVFFSAQNTMPFSSNSVRSGTPQSERWVKVFQRTHGVSFSEDSRHL